MPAELTWPTSPILSLITDSSSEGSSATHKVLQLAGGGGGILEEDDPADTPAVWQSGDTATFSATSLNNVLKFSVRFKARNVQPWVDSFARFLIVIDRFIGDSDTPWQREIRDPVCFEMPVGSWDHNHMHYVGGDYESWYYQERVYSLMQDFPFSAYVSQKPLELKFRIRGFIWIADWNLSPAIRYGPEHVKVFTSIIKPPKPELVKEQLAQLQAMQQDYMREFFKRFDDKPA